MNADYEDEKLDALLSTWKSESGSPARISDLHDRIVTSLMESHKPATGRTSSNGRAVALIVQPSSGSKSVKSSRWLSSVVVSTVATSLLAITFLLGGRDSYHALPATDLPPDYAWLKGDQLTNKAMLFGEMEDLFDHKVAWLSETNERMNIGLTADGEANDFDAGEHLAVRILVERRQPGTSTWQLALSMDVVSHSEEVVHVVPQDANGSELTLWTYRLPDGAIAVDSRVQIAGSIPFQAEASGLHHDGNPMQVATVQNKDADYRVFQTVAVLNGKVI